MCRDCSTAPSPTLVLLSPWSGKGKRSGGTVFGFRDSDTNITKTTMDENATKFIPISLKHFEDLSHVACDSCAKHLRENNKQAALALENQKRLLKKREQQHVQCD